MATDLDTTQGLEIALIVWCANKLLDSNREHYSRLRNWQSNGTRNLIEFFRQPYAVWLSALRFLTIRMISSSTAGRIRRN